MLVISLALAAVLLAGNGDDEGGASRALAPENTPQAPPAAPTDVMPPAETPELPVGPELPPDLQARVDALPEKLRDETTIAYESGALTRDQLEQLLTDYENRNPSLRVGSVLGATDGLLRFEVYTTGEQLEIATFEDTLIRRGESPIALEELMVDELVMVLTTEEGGTALTIDAFGVVAPQ